MDHKRRRAPQPTQSITLKVKDTQLARAFVLARASGYRLRVHAIDGVVINDRRDGEMVVMVDVFGGIVRKSWTSS